MTADEHDDVGKGDDRESHSCDRITETAGGTTTGFYYNGPQIIEQRQGSTVTSQNVVNIDYVNDLLLRDDNSTSGSLGVSGSGLGQRLYAQHDAAFDVTALVNTSGVVQERFIYSPYGNMTVLSAAWTPQSDLFDTQVGLQGMWLDQASGLYHTPNRDLNPATGTWLEADPAGYVDGTSLYQPFERDPEGLRDPAGLESKSAELQFPDDPERVNLPIEARAYRDEARRRWDFYNNKRWSSNRTDDDEEKCGAGRCPLGM